ncbi:MAG: agmatinase family protein [Thermaurantimonas sp.]
MKDFDPNGPAIYDGVFGLPCTLEESELVIVPVPWQVTVSYGEGTADAPMRIKEASKQVDLYHPLNPGAWKKGIHMLEPSNELKRKNDYWRSKVEKYLSSPNLSVADPNFLSSVNNVCSEMVDWVETESSRLLEEDKKVILLGGDHSTPLGYLKALARRYDSFGVLQIDAHMDFRKAYEGFEYSHASIAYNFLKVPQISKVTQVGIRDYCDEELEFAQKLGDRCHVFFSFDIKSRIYKGETWDAICDRIIQTLPENVYITFDIDGLDPKLCPSTGTPVPGGLEYEQIHYLFLKLMESNRKIIGADLNEVGGSSESEWDSNVGARVLYLLCNMMLI